MGEHEHQQAHLLTCSNISLITCSGCGCIARWLSECECVGGQSECELLDPCLHWEMVAVMSIDGILHTPVWDRKS